MEETVIGGYRIVSTLGAGGMGVVYAGEHALLGRKAAIKVLLPEYSHDQDIVTRFFNEARAATAIKHPGIVQIYDFGFQDDGSAYIAMEFLEGEGLDSRLKQRGPLPVQQALRFAGQMASALAAAHGHGIIHRDLKPANVFLVPDEQVAGGERIKLLDFGIAKFAMPDNPGAGQTRAGALMGSPGYMAPEQARGAGGVDHRADLYAVGCILFHMLCGRPPFVSGGHGPMVVLAAHLNEPPPAPSMLRPELTAEVDGLVLQLLAKDPAQRPADAAHMGHAVAAISGEAVSFASLPGVSGQSSAILSALGPRTGGVTGTGHGTGQLTGTMSAGLTGRQTGVRGPMGHGTGMQTGAGTQTTQTTQTGGSGRPWRTIGLLAGAAALAAAALFAFTGLGSDAPAPAPIQVTEVIEETPPEPPPPPAPKLTFRYQPLDDEPAPGDGEDDITVDTSVTGIAAGGLFSSNRLASVRLSALSLRSISISSVLSGNLFDGLMDTLTLLVQPEPVMITWQIATEPAGAEVLKDGEVVGTTERPLIVQFEETPEYVQAFTLRLDRHQDQTIELSGTESFDDVIALEPRAYATVESRPKGAEIIDAAGQSLGTAPMELALPDDGSALALTLRRERFEDTPVELAGTESFEQEVALVPKVYATISARPRDAEIIAADGTVLGTAPMELELPREVQPMTVTLRHERFLDTTVELAGEKSFKETVRLTPRVFATVESRPKGAEVFDAAGQSLGTAPVDIELEPDAPPVQVTLRLDGFEDTPAELAGKRSFRERIKLIPRVALTIESRPPGAEVFDASGASLGIAPVTVEHARSRDELAFVLKLAKHQDQRVELTPRRSRKTTVKLEPQPEPPQPVTIRIASKPPEAEVWKDGTLLGKAPVEDSFLEQKGRVTYVLKLDGHRDERVRLAGDRSVDKRVELRPKCDDKDSSRGRSSLSFVNPYDDPC